jgi:hypothetical protein
MNEKRLYFRLNGIYVISQVTIPIAKASSRIIGDLSNTNADSIMVIGNIVCHH